MQFSSGEIVIATTNKGKVREFAHRFAVFGTEVRSLNDYPDVPPIVEDGLTFVDNALIKAQTVARLLGRTAIADDSGLCVDALSGEPGVYSARYAGEHASDEDNIKKLLDRLTAAEGSSEFSGELLEDGARLLSAARFVCALALVHHDSEETVIVEMSCEGFIIDRPRGENGFGYDPVFYVPRYGRTMAQLSLAEKQSISHRGKALDALFNRF